MFRPDPFHLILANSLLQNVINFTVWFALVFWAFLETRSVFVTGMIGGIYLISSPTPESSIYGFLTLQACPT